MIFQYHQETDMLYIKLSDGESVESEEVADGIVLDFDADNHVIGIEIEDAENQVDLAHLELKSMPVSNLIFSERTPAAI
ncbi:MAG: DUF2283 domain-containing protein [Acidobacteriota bacterium]|nr:DUF2283 domain-containing protein [Acidobacteriota bacterium]